MNFGPFLANIISIRLIRGPTFMRAHTLLVNVHLLDLMISFQIYPLEAANEDSS